MSLVLQSRLPKESVEPNVCSISWGKRMTPIVIIQAYLWFTLSLFAFGPWQWPLRNPVEFYGFVFGCQVALMLGYLAVAHRKPRSSPQSNRPHRLIAVALWISLVVLPLTSYARTGRIVPDLLGSIANPGQAYLEAHMYSEQGTNAGAYLRIILSPLLVALFPLATYYWAKLSRLTRLSVLISAFGVFLISIATGQRRDIADLLLTLPLITLASHWAGVSTLLQRTRRRLSIVGLCIVAAFLAYFAYSHISRVGADTAAYAANPATQQLPERDHFLLEAIPEQGQPGFLALVNYLTTGYYGLSLSLDRPIEPMYGFGHSMFLTRNFARFTNDESFEQRSLPMKISEKDGFKYPVYWCTAYPYFINDLGIGGTILLMFGLGAILAFAWIDMLGGRSPYAVIMFWLITVLLFYLPATNRMLQDGEGVIAFYVWLIAYLRGRNGA